MKNALRIIGITVIALLAGFALASCDNGVGGRISIPELDIVNSSGKEPGAAVGAPESADVTHNSVTVSAVEAPGNGQTVEYGISTSNDASTAASWQESTTFEHLYPETDYYIFARSKEDDTHNAGAPSEGLQVTTIPSGKLAGAVVGTPVLNSKSTNSITVDTVAEPGNGQTVEYGINTSNTPPIETWQDSTTFSGLTPVSTYYIFARAKESETHDTGIPSLGLEVITTKSPGAVVAPTLNTNTAKSITVELLTGYGQDFEYAISTSSTAPSAGWVQDKITFSGLNPETAYYIFTRSLENATYYAGAPSAGLKVTTGQVGKLTITNIPQAIPEFKVEMGEKAYVFGLGHPDDDQRANVIGGEVTLDVYLRTGGGFAICETDYHVNEERYNWLVDVGFGELNGKVTAKLVNGEPATLQLYDGSATIDFNDYFEINLDGLLIILNYPHSNSHFGQFWTENEIQIALAGVLGGGENPAYTNNNGALVYVLTVKHNEHPSNNGLFTDDDVIPTGSVNLHFYHNPLPTICYVSNKSINLVRGGAIIDFNEYFELDVN